MCSELLTVKGVLAMRRRTFLQVSAAALGGAMVAACSDGDSSATSADSSSGGRRWVMPDEGQRHTRTWMAFAASEAIWGARLVPEVQRNLAAVATTIARFEPVSMLVSSGQMSVARQLIGGANVELVACPLDDLWIRDTGPVFVRSGGAAGGVDFNFNGWGRKQRYARDGEVADFVSRRAGAETLRTDLVLVTRRHLDILRAATDARGRRLTVEELESPSSVREQFANDDFAAGYVNFYVCNDAVIGPQFGAADTDDAAKQTLQRLFPDREVVQVNIDGIAAGGGGIHCATQQEPG